MKFFDNNFYSFTGEKKYFLCCKWNSIKRYYVLFLWCCIILSLYVCYDIPGSLQNQIMTKYQLTALEFAFLYSVYCWPNIVMCFVGGFLVDRYFGPKLGLIIYSGIAALGVGLFVTGGNTDRFFLMLAGRFLFGIGSESTVVTINNYVVQWFNGKELNMVFAIVLNIGRIGSSMVFESSGPTLKALEDRGVSSNHLLGYTLIALGSVILIGFICALLSALVDPELTEDEKNQEVKEKKEEKTVVKLTDVFKFPIQYWLLTIIIDVYITVIYSFLGLSQTSFTSKFNVSDSTANSYISFFSFFGVFLSPIVGIMIDKKGRNLSYITLAELTGILGFAVLAFTYITPYFSMLILSISIAALLSSAWSLFSYFIGEHQLGTAYGVVQSLMNAMASVGSIAAGAIADEYGHEMMVTFMVFLLSSTVPLLIWLWVLDVKHTKILNMSSTERMEFLEKKNSSNSGVTRQISTISNSYSEERKDVDTSKVNP